MRDVLLVIGLIILLIVGFSLMSNDDGTLNLMYSGELFGMHYFSMGKSGIYCDNPKNIELKPFHTYRVRLTSPLRGVVEGE